MRERLRRSGRGLAIGAVAWYCLNLAISEARGGELLRSLSSPKQALLLGLALLFALSTLSLPLRWLQPLGLLAATPLLIIPETEQIYGLGAFIAVLMLLERCGFFLRRRLLKIALLLAYFFLLETLGVLVSRREFSLGFSPFFFVVSFLGFMWFLYRERMVRVIREAKPLLSLTERGLSPAERAFVLSLVGGRTVKQIAIDFEVSESTVRNTLLHAYRKLEVEDTAGLLVLAATNQIVGD